MRTASLQDQRKLWGRIDDGLKAGKYTLEIDNQYDLRPYQNDGQKLIVFATSSTLGGKNALMGTCYLASAGVSFVMGIVYLIAWCMKKSHEN